MRIIQMNSNTLQVILEAKTKKLKLKILNGPTRQIPGDKKVKILLFQKQIDYHYKIM